jgi:hypothetical protein
MSKRVFTIRNRTAHVKHLGLTGGELITLPPTMEGASGVTVTLDEADANGIKRLAAALKTPTVKGWLDRKEIEVREGSSGEPGSAAGAPTEPTAPTEPPAPSEPTASSRRGGEHHFPSVPRSRDKG